MARLIDADELIELIDDDIASLDMNMPTECYYVCLYTLKMVKQYIKALPTVASDWKSIMDDWTEHDNAMIAKGRELEQRLNATKHGRWIKRGDNSWECSVCHEISCCNGNYCVDCGARMDGEENEL